jgi:outer membrane protein insertion porin family/translocation and assembly module TamA
VLLVLVCSLLVPHKRVSAQSTARCDQAERVRSIRIEGSEIQTDELLTVLATTGPSFFTRVFGIGSAPCIDSLEVERDGLRIAVLHRQRGWFSAAVRPVLNRDAKGTRVRFLVTPGPVARLRIVAVSGLPDSGANGTALDEPLTSLKGEVFDRVRVQQATDRVLGRLQDAGYARSAQPVSTASVDTAAALVDLSVAFEPGVPLRTGKILIDIAPVARRDPRYDSADVLRMSGLQSGERYRAVNVLDAQRALYRTDAFRLVLIDTVTPITSSPDSTIDLRISVAEARTRSARVGIGWGTLECGRVQGRITDRGFLGPGRRVEFVARASRLGIGRPLDQWPGLCPQFLRDDPYSQELNYYVGVSLGNSTFFGADLSPTIDVYSERRGEFNAFQLETDIGLGFALSKSLGRRTSATIGAEYESGRIVTDAVLACVRFALCQPADFALARQGNTTRAITASWFHDRVDNVTDPSRGGRLRADWRLGLTSFADLQDSAERRQAYAFSRPTLDATGFIPLGDGTIAARVQWSQVFAPNAIQIAGAPFLPPQERLFSGGQNTVRGYQQNLLGPVVYRVDRSGVDSVAFGNSYQLVVRPDAAVRLPSPEGGTGSVVANLEYRRRFGWPTRDLQWVAFVDAGTVWASGVSPFSVREIRTTPGIGVRLDTPLGPFRVDIGYNPLRADAGKAFLFDLVDTRRDGTGVPYVVCVSPGQELEFDEQIASGGLACPRTFRPAAGRSTLSRLVFHFSLGQAF